MRQDYFRKETNKKDILFKITCGLTRSYWKGQAGKGIEMTVFLGCLQL